jgi:excisionase family DNA binding protein
MQDNERLLTTKEVAEYIRCTPNAVRQLKKKRQISGFLTKNKRRLYTKAEIDEYLQRPMPSGPDEPAQT